MKTIEKVLCSDVPLTEKQKERLAAMVPMALDQLQDLMADYRTPARDRIKAAEIIIDRVMGKPEQVIRVIFEREEE
ncbi:MAG: hypothetical protein IKG23_04585 [Clostridia bacterium]|nr:hypothetical protein [Clostridia bacterium]